MLPHHVRGIRLQRDRNRTPTPDVERAADSEVRLTPDATHDRDDERQ